MQPIEPTYKRWFAGDFNLLQSSEKSGNLKEYFAKVTLAVK